MIPRFKHRFTISVLAIASYLCASHNSTFYSFFIRKIYCSMRSLKDPKRSDAIAVSVSVDTSSQVDALESKKKSLIKELFQAIVNAIMIGAVAKFLVLLINLFTNISFYGKFSFANSSPANNHLGLFVIIVPIIGGLIVGIMARFGSAAIRGHGIPEAMEQVLTNESRIKPVITFLKPISSAISIGTGGPFGAEGPIIATGGALGSVAGQIMHITASERKVMLTAGATAGMSAIFWNTRFSRIII